jgi:iron complex outermembrane recepter protein
MSHRYAKRQRHQLVPLTLGVGLVVGGSGAVFAADDASSPSLEEVVVTATRRATSVTDVPYNISAMSGTELDDRGVTSLSDLMQQIPGLSFTDAGAKYSRSTGQMIIIRGINATGAGSLPAAAIGQLPVATYYGETPLFAHLPMLDLDRVEVLRGPQGTLFGAGSLSGAVRFIPNAPVLGKFSGEASASVGDVAHSSGGHDTSLTGILNVPLGEIAAARLSAGHSIDAGYIDGVALYKRANNGIFAPVVQQSGLDSPPELAPAQAINWETDNNGRIALLVQPSTAFKATLAYNWVESRGGDSSEDNPSWPGGPLVSYASPPSGVVVPATQPYEDLRSSLQPWEQRTQVSSADIEFDFGFATLSSDTSYTKLDAWNITDGTFQQDGLPYAAYYAGSPRFPAFLNVYSFPDIEQSFTEELRWVSAKGKYLDWIGGLFFSRHDVQTRWDDYAPNMQTWKDFSGSPYPDSLMDPDGLEFFIHRTQNDKEEAAFGEATWHISEVWDLTGGVRLFRTTSDASMAYGSTTTPGYNYAGSVSSESSYNGHIFKVNTSYAFAAHQHLYATFSQGFRRGGSNAFPLTGLYPEPAAYLTYKPDFLTNYEIGVKGELSSRISYTFAVFYEKLRDVQIEGLTPIDNWPIVLNGGRADSRGFEFEFNGRLLEHLTANVGFAYADAKLSDSFFFTTTFGSLSGQSGQRLPGSAKTSAGLFLKYDIPLADSSAIDFDAGVNYKGSVVLAMPSSALPVPPTTGGYTLLNGSMSYLRGDWQAAVFVDNATDKRAVNWINPGYGTGLYMDQSRSYFINHPRTVGLRLTYRF